MAAGWHVLLACYQSATLLLFLVVGSPGWQLRGSQVTGPQVTGLIDVSPLGYFSAGSRGVVSVAVVPSVAEGQFRR